jgi:Asp-tRNA(Asn)/Glu-tRNA(Gln) amidotransferase C subunit
MAQIDNDLSVTLPEELRRQFAAVRRRLWQVETTVAVCWVLAGLIVSVLALFISDRLWNTPVWLRMLFFLAGLCVTAGAAWQWSRHWIWNRRTDRDLAKLVQKKYRLLGDRLLGIVELAQEQAHQANFSPALYHAAIRQVAGEAKEYDFGQSVNGQRAKKLALTAAAGVAVWFFLALALPQASWNAFLRWVAPAAGVPRYSLVSLEGLPSEVIVPYGEPFVVSGDVRYRSWWKPGHVSAQLPNPPLVEGAVDGGKIHLQVPGQLENGVLRLQVGDARAEVKVKPVHRPSLSEMSAVVQLPAYLHYPDQTEVLQSGSMLAVEGSRIEFHGKVTRPLSSAVMQPEGGQPAPLKIDGENFSSAPAQPEMGADYIFNWRDNLGMTNASPLRLAVQMQKDAPPVPELTDLPRETAMLASDVMRIRMDAIDDFGVSDIGLTWDVNSSAPLTESVTTEIKTVAPNTHVKKLEKVFLWSPDAFRIPVDSTVELTGYARDFFPDRERTRTGPYHIRVLSPQEHAEMVREQLEAVMAQVEEVTRLQEKIVANLSDVQQNAKLPESQKSSRVGQSKEDQLQNASHLDQLSKQGERALQEAMKNPVFPADTIRQWSQSTAQWQKLAQDKMQDAASAMQSAQHSSPSHPQSMADATQKAQDILKALEKMQNKANQQMDDLQALTLSQRLRQAGTREKEIGGQLLKSAPATIGLLPQELPEKWKQLEASLIQDQGHVLKESDTLEGEISRFYERTQKTNYGEVSREMKAMHTSDELDRLGGLIGDNIGLQASSSLGQWSGHFQTWSDKLEPKTDSSKSNSSSSGKSSQKDLTEQLIALLRLREGEINLHDQTTVLDQQKGDPSTFKNRAAALSDAQKKIAASLDKIEQQLDLAPLKSSFSETSEAMEGVESILQKPDTGPPADHAEVKTIDDLSDLVNLINEQAQRPNPQQSASSSSSSAEEMAFLMRMMQNTPDAKAMALKPATGLNHNGGTTDRQGHPITGDVNGKNGPARKVNEASGVIENSPTEFRDALDNYFHGLEKSKQ